MSSECRKCETEPLCMTNDDAEVWFECPVCHASGGKYNLRSDDFALTNAERSWDRSSARLASEEKETADGKL